MIRDRKLIKWLPALMMPEHKKLLNDVYGDIEKVNKPLLTQEKMEELDLIICEAMENNNKITVTYFSSGSIGHFIGNIHYISPIEKELRIVNEFHDILRVKFNDVINIYIS